MAGTTAEADAGTTTARYHIIKPPATDKEKAIVDAAIEMPRATNEEIADRADELDEGIERPDPSWVSRVRNEFLELVEDEAPATTDAPDGTRDVDVLVERVEQLEREIDTIIDNVKSLHESVDRLERQEREAEITRLESRLDELRGDVTA